MTVEGAREAQGTVPVRVEHEYRTGSSGVHYPGSVHAADQLVSPTYWDEVTYVVVPVAPSRQNPVRSADVASVELDDSGSSTSVFLHVQVPTPN